MEAHTSPLLSELTKLEPPWVDLFFTTSDWILPNEHLLLPLLSLATSERSSVTFGKRCVCFSFASKSPL